MKIRSIEIRNYKKFQQQFRKDFHPDLTLLVGENGIGKSSIMQMIAAVIGTATQDLRSPSELNWPGFNFSLLNSGRAPLQAHLDFSFTQAERQATLSLFDRFVESREVTGSTRPNNLQNVRLSLDYANNNVIAQQGAGAFFQFRGYSYAKMVSAFDSDRQLFNNVGKAYWYTEERNTLSFTKENGDVLTEDKLRQFLISRYNFHNRVDRGDFRLRQDQRDIFEDLQRNLQTVFPNRRFSGSAPRTSATEAFEVDWFFLAEGNREYEVSEMSAGERAIFPILIDFANWKINNSIILIDELELHLHPPLQQAFLNALQSFGSNNQFIISTHSDYIASLVDESQIIRL
jgi:predicted ATPase